MSTQEVETVLRRAADDAEFRDQMRDDPDRALHGYDISYAERQALIAGDVAELERMGVPAGLSEVAPTFNRRTREA